MVKLGDSQDHPPCCAGGTKVSTHDTNAIEIDTYLSYVLNGERLKGFASHAIRPGLGSMCTRMEMWNSGVLVPWR